MVNINTKRYLEKLKGFVTLAFSGKNKNTVNSKHEVNKRTSLLMYISEVPQFYCSGGL